MERVKVFRTSELLEDQINDFIESLDNTITITRVTQSESCSQSGSIHYITICIFYEETPNMIRDLKEMKETMFSGYKQNES